jgi:predicted peptidase
MRYATLAILIAAALALLNSQSLVQAANVNDFIDFSYSASGSVIMPGRLYVPPEAISDPTTPRPLILFLHGAGEVGSDNLEQINLNIDNLLAGAKQRGAFLYAPQTGTNWALSFYTNLVNTMLLRAVSEQNVDADRLYVTGLSMGGGGTWNMLNRYPELFAAGVPICGVAPAGDFVASNLVDQAVWAFHARDDNVVNAQHSRNRINAILSAGNASLPVYPSFQDGTTTLEFASESLDVRYTEWPTGGHDVWHRVYSSDEMYDWMFAHTLAVPEPQAVLTMTAAAVALLAYCRRVRRTR